MIIEYLHGVYAIHTNIPSEPQLEEEFKVSKITVRNAIKELAQEGYLEKKSGKGRKSSAILLRQNCQRVRNLLKC